jgi:hypothetical protein
MSHRLDELDYFSFVLGGLAEPAQYSEAQNQVAPIMNRGRQYRENIGCQLDYAPILAAAEM